MHSRRSPSRRALLRLGATAAWAGVTVPRFVASAPAAGAAPRAGRARSCILLYMEGGPSQLDTFDPKPGRPTGGPWRAIESSVPGIRVSEHLPRLARRMKHMAIVRSLTSKEGNHDRARHLMHTGYPPQGGVDHPAFGSVVAASAGAPGDGPRLPGYVSIGGPGEDAGFLGAGLSPFPVLNPAKPTRNISLARGIDERRFARRLDLWRGLQRDFEAAHPGSLVAGQREVGEQAVALMRAPGAAAFDLSSEPETVRRAYGDSSFGSGCLMARRLVAEHVPFVEVMLRGWDTHENNFPRVKDLCAVLDKVMSTLLDDLAGRGLLESTLVVWMGDFGRTPRINERGGRDHFPAASSVVVAGGGVVGGQVIGSTTADGDAVATRPVTVPDLYRSVAWALNLDADKTRFAPSGRPIKTVDGGTVMRELF
ncbi:MAG: DUF1501 domain-containing protein [Pseudomonadota bacterium]